jgi:hypothetical protein
LLLISITLINIYNDYYLEINFSSILLDGSKIFGWKKFYSFDLKSGDGPPDSISRGKVALSMISHKNTQVILSFPCSFKKQISDLYIFNSLMWSNVSVPFISLQTPSTNVTRFSTCITNNRRSAGCQSIFLWYCRPLVIFVVTEVSGFPDLPYGLLLMMIRFLWTGYAWNNVWNEGFSSGFASLPSEDAPSSLKTVGCQVAGATLEVTVDLHLSDWGSWGMGQYKWPMKEKLLPMFNCKENKIRSGLN